MLQAIGSKQDLALLPFYGIISDLLTLTEVQKLQEFRHHKRTTRFQHSLNVAYYNYLLCRRFGLDAEAGARAGMLHDLFFYNRKEYVRVSGEAFHNARHPRMACDAADHLCELSAVERDMILKHMWPVTITKLPRYRESLVIVLVDKFCAILEISSPLLKRVFPKKAFCC